MGNYYMVFFISKNQYYFKKSKSWCWQSFHSNPT